MTFGELYSRKSKAFASRGRLERRVKTLETDIKTFTPLTAPTVIQELEFQFQSTQFTRTNAAGTGRVYANSASSSINEETEPTVAAYATFDDVGGNGTAASSTPFGLYAGSSTSESFTTTSFTGASFVTTVGGAAESVPTDQAGLLRVPLEDNEGRTAYYHGHWKYIGWNPYFHPTAISHQNQFMRSNSVELNVPGTVGDDKACFVYYDSHANFNISASTSVSLWFYPTDLSSISGETWRTLLYRRIDASNYYTVVIKPSDSKLYVFVNEAGATTKLVSTAAVNANAWNNIIFTYNPATNALVIYLNDSTASSTPADTYSPPYTADANLYLGGIPTRAGPRFTGYLDNFVFWTGKILSAGEADNMWNRGTII